ncbi:MAG: SDR family oxidoreductase [Opitutales bacterium]|nr:SDR family oxidoreductase [Opitutales bacterium]
MEKRILIYGGSGGIGKALAKKLSADGFRLHLVGRNNSALEKLADELDATFTVGDVCDEELFSQVAEAVDGPLLGLVYAVGTIDLRPLNRFSSEDFVRDFTINAAGAARAIQAALPALKKAEAGASVVLFSSVAAQKGFGFHASVGMAKGAVSGLTLALAAELAPKIRVNAIAPSLTDTPLAKRLLSNEKTADALARAHPLQRLGKASDAANMAAFLLSEQSSWITGQILAVDGGRGNLQGNA